MTCHHVAEMETDEADGCLFDALVSCVPSTTSLVCIIVCRTLPGFPGLPHTQTPMTLYFDRRLSITSIKPFTLNTAVCPSGSYQNLDAYIARRPVIAPII